MEAQMIDPNDPIEKLVVESIDLMETARKLRYSGLPKGVTEDDVFAMEWKSDELWEKAKRLGRPNVRQENYEDLANAILKKAVEDYEDLMCGTEHESEVSNIMSMPLIEKFLKRQTFVKLDMIELLNNIKRVYAEKFVPYAKKYRSDICNQWDEFNKQGLSVDDRIRYTKHRCPLCKGCLKPIDRGNYYNIGCTSCHLVAYFNPKTMYKGET